MSNTISGEKKTMIACAVSVGLTAMAAAADYYVAEGGTGDYSAGNPGPSLVQAAQLATGYGDVIHLAPGMYSHENADVFVAAGVTVTGDTDHSDDVVITRVVTGTNDRVVYLGIGAMLRNLTVRGGYTDYQAACILGYNQSAGYVHKDFSVSNCVVEGGSALFKGGASMGGVWRNCVIRNCAVRNPTDYEPMEGSGGGIWGGTLYDCVISNNHAVICGGGLSGNAEDPAVAYNCTFVQNTAPYGAGAGTLRGRSLVQLVGCRLVGNSAVNPGFTWGGRGGGAYGCQLTNCVVRGNVATFHGASEANSLGGGGIALCSAFDCDILENAAKMVEGGDRHVSGGGAENSYLENCLVRGNSAQAWGGGTIASTNVNCWLSENSAVAGGAALGGVFQECVISNNFTTEWEGGAAYNARTRNCLVIHNTSAKGAVLFRGYHEGDLIVGNVMQAAANDKSLGSAISPLDGTDLATCDAVAVNCTLVGNTGGEAAIWAVCATNCLLAGNVPYDVKWMSQANTCMWVTDGNPERPDETATPAVNCAKIDDPKFVAEPRAGECAYSLRLSSPCRDKGVFCDWMTDATDLLGNPRVKFDAVDIGALECSAKFGAAMIIR